MDNIQETRKLKGELAELMVACDLPKRGCKLAIPWGEDCDYDLVIERNGRLERVQVKHTHRVRRGSRRGEVLFALSDQWSE